MIEFDNVSFSYDPHQLAPVIRDLDLRIPPGQHLALLGRNGSGKSTIARLVNGLYQPTRGSVRVDSQETSRPGELAAVRAAVQLVFQNPENQQVGTTVYEDIAFGLANRAVPTEQMEARARQALDQAGLDIDLDRDIRTLSGGELQRFALAGVLALRPRYLVLDEATSMLDPAGRARFLAGLARLTERGELGIIQITHHLDEIETADRAIVLIDGRIAHDGTPRTVLGDAGLLGRAGLERPRSIIVPGRGRAGTAPVRERAGALSPADGTPSILALENVDYSHERARRRRRTRSAPVLQLDGVTVAFQRGELVAIAGRSGAGKTTLLNVIKGISRPTGGAVTIGGADPWKRKNRQLFTRIGYVLQHPEHQLFAPTVHDDVAFALRGQGHRTEDIDTRVRAQLEAFGLDSAAISESSPFALSGGQQRRVAMAGVLIAEPELLLLDEPTAGLDAPSRDALFATLHRAADAGTTVIWVSHRLEEIADHATRLVVVDAGRLAADADPAAVLSDEQLMDRLGWAAALVHADEAAQK